MSVAHGGDMGGCLGAAAGADGGLDQVQEHPQGERDVGGEDAPGLIAVACW